MEIPGAGLRFTSSLFLAPVVGLIFSTLGAFLLPHLPPDLIGSYLYLFLGVFFVLGLGLMWLLHNFYHSSKVLYIIILVLAIPLTILGIVVGLASMSGLNDLNDADLPGEYGVHAALGGVMMLAGVAIGIYLTVIGLLSIASTIFGLIAFGVRRKALPDHAPVQLP